MKSHYIRDSMIADLIQQGYARKAEYGVGWDTVDICEYKI